MLPQRRYCSVSLGCSKTFGALLYCNSTRKWVSAVYNRRIKVTTVQLVLHVQGIEKLAAAVNSAECPVICREYSEWSCYSNVTCGTAGLCTCTVCRWHLAWGRYSEVWYGGTKGKRDPRPKGYQSSTKTLPHTLTIPFVSTMHGTDGTLPLVRIAGLGENPSSF